MTIVCVCVDDFPRSRRRKLWKCFASGFKHGQAVDGFAACGLRIPCLFVHYSMHITTSISGLFEVCVVLLFRCYVRLLFARIC